MFLVSILLLVWVIICDSVLYSQLGSDRPVATGRVVVEMAYIMLMVAVVRLTLKLLPQQASLQCIKGGST